jgi:hypothetical protein
MQLSTCSKFNVAVAVASAVVPITVQYTKRFLEISLIFILIQMSNKIPVPVPLDFKGGRKSHLNTIFRNADVVFCDRSCMCVEMGGGG